MKTGIYDTRSGDLVFFSVAFGEFSLFKRSNFIKTGLDFDQHYYFMTVSFDQKSCSSLFMSESLCLT